MFINESLSPTLLLTSLSLDVQVFWDVMLLYHLMISSQSFEGSQSLHCKGSAVELVLKILLGCYWHYLTQCMEALQSFATLATAGPVTQRHVQGDTNLQQRHCENLKSYKSAFFVTSLTFCKKRILCESFFSYSYLSSEM